MRLTELEFAEIRNGNELLVSCVGAHACGGFIGIPFAPGIGGAPDGKPEREGGVVWKRTGGETLEDLTLTPSINAHECGHFHVTSGEVVTS